jgi:ArsR family transcriptional regulator
LRLVQLLRAGPQNVSELAAQHGGDIANVSHHLQILLRERIVQRERHGRFIIYALHPDVCSATPEANDHIDLGCCRLELPKEW